MIRPHQNNEMVLELLCVVTFFIFTLFVVDFYELYRMDKFITLILHHGGSFKRDKNRKLEYVDGEVDVWKNINPHLLNISAIKDKVKRNRGYHNIVGLYYLKPYEGVKLDMNICLRSLTTENHCIDMLNVAKMNDKVDIYFEHSIIQEHQFLPPPPGFKPKKIPPPQGFSGKEYI
jgi:hypothetical protein